MSSTSCKEYSGLARGRVLVMRSFLLLLLIAVEPSTNALSCSQFCELLESGQYSGIFPAECACSFNNRLRAGSLDKEKNLGATPTVRDAEIYYEPVESHVPYYISFVEQPFYIINPAIKKMHRNNAEYKKSLFNENIPSAINDLHQTVTKGSGKQKRKGNYIHKIGIQTEELPFYLDIGIHKPKSNERTVSKEVLGIESKEDLEQNLKECVDLHILMHIRNSTNADLKDIWDENKIKRYNNLSNTDLKTKIKNKCKLPANVVQESLDQIKKSWPNKYNTSDTHTQHTSTPASNVYKQNKNLTLRQSNLPINNDTDNVSLGSEFSELSTEYVDTFTSYDFNIEDYTANYDRQYSEYEPASLDTTTKDNLVSKYFTLKATTDHNEIISSTILPLESNELNSSKSNQIPYKNADNIIDSLIQRTDPNGINKNPGLEYDENENFDEIANLISSLKNTGNLLIQEEHNNDANINKKNVGFSQNITKQQVSQENDTIALLTDVNLVTTYDEMSTNSDPKQHFEITTPLNLYVQGHNRGMVTTMDNLENNPTSDHSIDKIPPTFINRNSYGLSTTESNKRTQNNPSPHDLDISDQDTQSSNPASIVIKFGDTIKHNDKRVNPTSELPVEEIWTDSIYQDIIVENITDRPYLTTNKNLFIDIMSSKEKSIAKSFKDDSKNNFTKNQITEDSGDLAKEAELVSFTQTKNIGATSKKNKVGLLLSSPGNNYYFESNEAVPSVEKPPTIFKETFVSNQNKLSDINNNKRVQYFEKDMKIPKIITKELVNDKAESEINGIELLPNNDFIQEDAKKNSEQDITNIPRNILTVETTNGLRDMNNSDVVGNLYFLFNNHSIPAHFVQNTSGEIKLGIDGNTFCDKYKEKATSDSIILTTICNCLRFDKCK